MAYPGTPTDLTDGDYLPASWLNQLASCAAYLQGVGEPSNPGFLEQYLTDATTLNYRFRHRHRYFKMLYSSNGDSGEVDDIKLYYNGTLVHHDSSPNTVSDYTVTIDLNDTGIINPTPTIGDWYTAALVVSFYSSGYLQLKYLCEQSDNVDL